MGRCQCVETSCLVPPGGDSREQGDHIHLPFIQEGEGWEEEQQDPIDFSTSLRIKEADSFVWSMLKWKK